MGSLKTILRLVRAPNIIIIGLTTYFIRLCIFSPDYGINHIEFFLNDFQFILLTVAIMFATAGGYLINDIYDRPIDKINKLDKVYIGNRFSLRFVVYLYIIVNIIGLLLSLIIAVQVKYVQWLFFYPLAAIILWFYSYYLKRTVLLGNIIVALFCGLIVLLIWFSEKESIQELSRINSESSNKIFVIVFFYSLFAFLSTLFREIIKDIEDIEGDRLNNCNTIAIKYGIERAKTVSVVVAFLLLIVIGMFILVNQNILNVWGMIYSLFCLILPIIYAIYRVIKAEDDQDFISINRIIKIIMVLGLLYLPVLSFI